MSGWSADLIRDRAPPARPLNGDRPGRLPSGAAVHSRALGFGSTGGLCMAKVGRNHVAGLLALTVAALVAVAVPAFALGTSRTAGASKPSGKLYAQTNGLSGNQI